MSDHASYLSHGTRRRGVTLVEIVVVLACAAMLLGILYQLWVTATRYSRELEARFDILSRAQVALARLSRELAGSRRVLYPAPGRAEESLVVIDGLARPVTYWLDRTGQPARLMRTEAGSPPGSFLEGVLECRFKVATSPEGRDPGLVHVTLGLAGVPGRSVPVFAGVRLRALDVRCGVYR
jgi:prepilin-type N-terminal cleavage/methylation domain-containing protein